MKIPGNKTTHTAVEGVGRNNYEAVHDKMQKQTEEHDSTDMRIVDA